MRNILVAVLLLFAVILSAGCVAEKTVEVGDEVSVYYTLSLDDGTVQESNVGFSPISFVVGDGRMVSGFDAAVIGMKVGETKKVRLSPSEAYGEYLTFEITLDSILD
jgi:peptidylprolyl isomerase